MTAIFASEFGQKLRFRKKFVLRKYRLGVPSIIAGVFAYGYLVPTTKGSFSRWFPLAVIMLPM